MSREKGGMRSPSLLCALPKGKGVPKGKGDVRGVGGSNRKQIKQLDHSLNEKKKHRTDRRRFGLFFFLPLSRNRCYST